MPRINKPTMRAIELFAGVGGFRLGLEPSGWKVVWSNQWEPSTKRQYACECYISHFGDENFLCKDIKEVLDEVEAGILKLPDHELLVGGFPCQDYSVARTLSQAAGIQGKKGVLWWEIYRLLRIKRPKMVLCDHPGNRPSASARGRDRAGMIRGRSRRGFILNPGCALRDDNFQ